MNFMISSDVTTEIQSSVLKTMSRAPIEDRPVIVKFILQSMVSQAGGELVSAIGRLRENLELSASKLFTATQVSPGRKCSSARTSGSTQNAEVMLIMDNIRMSITKDRKIADAWFRVVEKPIPQSIHHHKPIDIFVLLLLHELPQRKRPVELLFKNKIRSGTLSEEHITKAFAMHKRALQPHFESLHAIAECLLRCIGEPALTSFSTTLHREMFLHFEQYWQQEIVGDLVTTVSSCGGGFRESGGGPMSVRSTALATLDHLSRQHTGAMAPYSLFVAHLLDYLDWMNLQDVRQVMDILAKLAYSSHCKASTLRDDLHIVVRKQLSVGGCGDVTKGRIKRMGVIGAVVLVKNMSLAATRDEADRVESSHASQDTSAGSSASTAEILKQATDVLERVKNATQTAGELSGLFMDELANVVQELASSMEPRLVDWISKKMADEFQDDFIEDYSKNDLGEEKYDRPDKTFFVPMTLQYNIEKIAEGTGESEDSGEPEINIAIDLTKKKKGSTKGTAGQGSSSCWSEKGIKGLGLVRESVDRFIPHFRYMIQ